MEYDEIKKIFTQFKEGKKHNYMKNWFCNKYNYD
jgi:hypothetical protein